MRKHKITVLILIIIISASFALSGCSAQNEEPVATEKPIVSSDEPLEVSVAMWEMFEPQGEAATAIYNYIEENFNIKIKPTALSSDNYEDELNWMFGANMLPDVFAHDVIENRFQYKAMISAGAVREIPKEMWAKLENLSAVMSWYEDVYSYSGQMYFIPRTYQTFDQTHGATNVILYRSDWAKDLSHSTYTDNAEFTDIAMLLADYRGSDTDGNSIWDTWGITGSGGIDFIWDMFLTPFGVREWMLEDGQWIPGIISTEAKEAIAWAAQLYRQGTIDPDISSQSATDALNKFLTGKAGAVLTSAYYSDIVSFEEQWDLHNPDKSITKSVKIIPVYTAPNGERHNEVETFDTGSMISSNVSDEKLENILLLYDFLFGQEGRNLIEYGNVNGIETGQSIESYLSDSPEFISFSNLASWSLDKNPISGAADSDFTAYATAMVEENIWPWSYESELFANGMITPEISGMDINYVAQEKILTLIRSTRDFDADWESFVNSMYSELNLNEAIAEVNEWAQQYFAED